MGVWRGRRVAWVRMCISNGSGFFGPNRPFSVTVMADSAFGQSALHGRLSVGDIGRWSLTEGFDQDRRSACNVLLA